MPKIIVGLGVGLLGIMMAGNAWADITARWIGSCDYLLGVETGTDLDYVQNYCNSIGTTSAYCTSQAPTSLTGDATYRYCMGQKWYGTSGVDHSGTGVFCFTNVSDCVTMTGLSGNTHSTTKNTVKKGFEIGSGAYDYMMNGNTKMSVAILNTEFFECTASCGNWTDWNLNSDGVSEARDKQFCQASYTYGSFSSVVCRPEAGTSVIETRCIRGYYDRANYSGVSIGLPAKVACVKCPSADGVPEEYITTTQDGVGSHNYEYYCVVLANKEIEDASGKYSFTKNCEYIGDGSDI